MGRESRTTKIGIVMILLGVLLFAVCQGMSIYRASHPVPLRQQIQELQRMEAGQPSR